MPYKMIGIKVSKESGLPDRLKIAAKKRHMSYAELLDYLLSLDNINPEPVQLPFFPVPPPTPEPQPVAVISHATVAPALQEPALELKTNSKASENEARILTLEETIYRLNQSLQAFIEKIPPAPVQNLPEAKPESPEMPFWKIRLMENLT